MQNLQRVFRRNVVPPTAFDPLDVQTEVERRQAVLRVLAPTLALLGAGIAVVATKQGYIPDPSSDFLITQVLPPVLLVVLGLVTWGLNRYVRGNLPGYFFTVGYGLIICYFWLVDMEINRNFNNLTAPYLLGLTILLAGVFIGGRAALVTIFVLFGVKYISIKLGDALALAIFVFWWLIGTVSWQYEKSLHQAFTRLHAAHDNLEDLVAVRTRELEKAKEEAEAANIAKSAFLASMSHELRTPMNAILGFAQLMEHSPDLPPAQQENLGIISRSGEHLLQLINDVLEMSKIEAGRAALNVTAFDLYQLLDSLEDMLYARAESKGLLLSMDYDFDVPRYIRSDEGKLRQVLLNLLTNAIKFTDEGGVTLHIASRTADAAYCLAFEVTDTGQGIDPAEMHKLFQAFSQTSSGETMQEGTGLGLAISRQFVEIMGGTIHATSAVGKGSIFGFDILAAPASEHDMDTIQFVRRVTGIAPGQPTYRIVITEDKWENRTLLRRLLEPLGFELREALNGQEAVKLAEEWQPHLIFMDMRMPVMDGHEATRQIKSTIQGQAIAIIALTASVFEHERMSVLEDGCDDFVRKPFREAVIFEKLAQHLGIQFVYEEKPKAAASRPTRTITVESLQAAAPDWIARLHHAASMADTEATLSIIAEMQPADDDLTASLQRLVDEFRFDRIIALTQSSGA